MTDELARVRPLFEAACAAPYFGTNGYGVMPRPAAQLIGDQAMALTKRAYGAHHRLETEIEIVRAKVATSIGAGADDIAFIRNTADGMSFAANALPFAQGDEVVTFDDDYGTVTYPFLARATYDESLAVRVCPTDNGLVTVEAVNAAITDRTRCIALSWVRWDTGNRCDLTAIGNLCASRGIWLVVDAIQGVGALPIDVGAARVSILAAGCHKWQCGLAGLGIMYVRAELLERLRPVRSGLTHFAAHVDAKHTRGYPMAAIDGARRFEDGANNELAIAALGVSLDIAAQVGIDRISNAIENTRRHLINRWRDLGGFVISSDRVDAWSGIVALHPPSYISTEEFLSKCWADRITVGTQRDALVPAIHHYTTIDDVERLVGHLR